MKIGTKVKLLVDVYFDEAIGTLVSEETENSWLYTKKGTLLTYIGDDEFKSAEHVTSLQSCWYIVI